MSYPVRYAQVDGLNLAYQVVGDGPIDLVMVDEWATPLEGRWDVPAIASPLNRLASFARSLARNALSCELVYSACCPASRGNCAGTPAPFGP